MIYFLAPADLAGGHHSVKKYSNFNTVTTIVILFSMIQFQLNNNEVT